jgi:hypothetical protein
MLWTQNAWGVGATRMAGYRCSAGHVLDPTTTKQCPRCGVHDTRMVQPVSERQQFLCERCNLTFEHPRD